MFGEEYLLLLVAVLPGEIARKTIKIPPQTSQPV
jgi:hypothetical protein